MKRNGKIWRGGYLVHFIAGLMIACLLLADVSMYIRLASGGSLCFAEKPAVNDQDGEYEIIENHLMETAMADGNYDDENSDSENGDDGKIQLKTGKKIFNILEILPSESKGVIGYMISGCMPFDNVEDIKDPETGLVSVTASDMREAYMDGLANNTPGVNNESKGTNSLSNDFLQLPAQMNNESGIRAYDLLTGGEYNGYYKYVGYNKGVFAYVGPTIWEDKPDIQMKSRFYNYDPNADYGYIFIYGDPNQANTSKNDKKAPNHKRVKYVNNEKFIREYLQVNNYKELSGEAAARKWREDHACSVTTRSPQHVTLDDIEKADIIFIRDAGKDVYYQHAIPVNNLVNGRSSNDGADERFVSGVVKNGDTITGYTMKNDFDDFEKVIRIYERVAVRQDVALVVEKIPAFRTTTSISSNIHKLIAMLYYVKQGINGQYGSGRLLFTDFMKRYTSEPGIEYMKLRNDYDQHKTEENGTNKYPDYRAYSLRKTEDKNDPAYYYMHYHTNVHVGHPLVLEKGMAITGGTFSPDGKLIPLKYDTNVDENGNPRNLYPITLERYASDKNMFDDPNDPSGHEYKIDYKTNGKDSEGRDTYYHEGAYESMSNTTDYVYLDENGSLIIDDKYSSNNRYDEQGNKIQSGYWYKIDYDGEVKGKGTYACRRRLWSKETYSTWPWDNILSAWYMHRKDETYDSYDCNMHMWYDYYGFVFDRKKRFYALSDTKTDDEVKNEKGSEDFGQVYVYENECLVQENHLFKTKDQNFIATVLEKRVLKREEEDDRHEEIRSANDYYISMNVVNGDGYNKSEDAGKNKTLYFNEYEVKREGTPPVVTTYPDIPLTIKVKSTCPIMSVSLISDTQTVPLKGYVFNYDVINDEDEISGAGYVPKVPDPSSNPKNSGLYEMHAKKTKNKKGANITSYVYSPTEDTEVDTGKKYFEKVDNEETEGVSEGALNLESIEGGETLSHTHIYAFSGQIPVEDVALSSFYNNKNTKLKVVMTVILPDEKDPPTYYPIEDTITIVRRDFFMLN